MVIPYYKMNAFLVNGYTPVYSNLLDYKPTLKFTEYLKSQLHSNIITTLYQRDIFNYAEALKFMNGEDRYFDSYKQSIKYFYRDMGNMLGNLLPKVNEFFELVDFNIPRSEILECVTVNLEELEQDILLTMSNKPIVNQSNSKYLEQLQNIPFTVLGQVTCMRMLALTLILTYHGTIGDAVRLEVI